MNPITSFLFFVLVLTGEYWMPAAVYVLLRTCLWHVGTALVWLAAAAGVLGFLGGLAYFIAYAFVRIAPANLAVMRAKKADDQEAYCLNLEEWRIQLRKARLWPIGLAMASVSLILPAAATLGIATGRPPLVVVQGELQYPTHDDGIRLMLHRMEKRGIFTPLNRD